MTILFCAAITIPCVGTWLGWDFHPPRNENRRLASLPVFEDTEIGELPDAFEEYFKDHFGFRNTLIRRYRKWHYNLVGTRPEHVLIGKDDWIFFTRRGIMNDFRGENKLDPKELSTWRRVLETKANWLKRRGMGYMFVIAPNKVQIYPEYLPADIQTMQGRSRAEQIVEFMHQQSDVDVLYPKSQLIAAKEQQTVYFPNDTHWNDHGSLVAQEALVKHLQTRYPKLRPLTLDRCRETTKAHPGDLANLIGLVKKYTISRTVLTPKAPQAISAPSPIKDNADVGVFGVKSTVNPKGQGRVLIFHDSFATFGIKDFLPEVFKEVVFVHDYPSNETFKKHVEAVKPDLVIELYVERQLGMQAARDKMEIWFQPMTE